MRIKENRSICQICSFYDVNRHEVLILSELEGKDEFDTLIYDITEKEILHHWGYSTVVDGMKYNREPDVILYQFIKENAANIISGVEVFLSTCERYEKEFGGGSRLFENYFSRQKTESLDQKCSCTRKK